MSKLAIIILLFLLAVCFFPKNAIADVSLPSDLNTEGLTPDTPLALIGEPRPAGALIDSMKFGPELILTLNRYDSNPVSLGENPKVSSVAEVRPTPSPTSVPTTSPTVSPTPISQVEGGLNSDMLFSMVNSHRQSLGLASLQTNPDVCQLASERAPMVDHEIATGTMHSGLKNFDFPYWNTENIISMSTNQGAFNWWINDPIHREAIEGDFKYSCLKCSGYACAEEFTNLIPK